MSIERKGIYKDYSESALNALCLKSLTSLKQESSDTVKERPNFSALEAVISSLLAHLSESMAKIEILENEILTLKNRPSPSGEIN